MKREQHARRDPVRILVVEDDLAARHIILRLLQQLGHRDDSACNGAEAIVVGGGTPGEGDRFLR